MVPQVAGTLLQNDHGGKGILLSACPACRRPRWSSSARAPSARRRRGRSWASGPASTVLDRISARLQRLDEPPRASAGTPIDDGGAPVRTSGRSWPSPTCWSARFHVPGARSPIVVTREMVRSMKPRSVVMDIAIDQGGCVETSRPTTHRDPTFVEENVIHYCVPNMTSVVARVGDARADQRGVAVHRRPWPTTGSRPRWPRHAGPQAGRRHAPGAMSSTPTLAAHLGVPEVTL